MTDQTHADDILSDASDRGAAVLAGESAERFSEAERDATSADPVTPGPARGPADYDAVIVGASLAGCSAAIFLARAGARVALVEKSPDAGAFKRVCSHYIQSSAVPTLERLGLLERMTQAGALHSRARIWTRFGWIQPPHESSLPSGLNLRRELLDPMVRQMAAETPGVELILGHTVQQLIRDDDRVIGAQARDAHNRTVTLRARLVVGADGRGSRVAKLAGVHSKTVRHGRFAYGGYFEGPAPAGAPDASMWLLDPDMAAVFPTDGGLNFYAGMPTMERLSEFREDPVKALVEHVAGVPEAPPIRESRLVQPLQGKLDMTNVAHTPTAPGLALVGDAALAIDPLWGVGCGWAFQSSEWLADSIAPALGGSESLDRGLKRYHRRHTRKLRGHTTMMYGYTGGRVFNRGEKGLFFAASRNERVGEVMEAFATRNIGPARMFATTLPRTTLITTRNALRGRAGVGDSLA
jgi:2-polyprenyl-6-methoxyphenol hydroxylase-like FAD-dependent oxidoreductase